MKNFIKILIFVLGSIGVFFQFISHYMMKFYNDPYFEGLFTFIIDLIIKKNNMAIGAETQLYILSNIFLLLTLFSTALLLFLILYTGSKKQRNISAALTIAIAWFFYFLYPDWLMEDADIENIFFSMELVPLTIAGALAFFLPPYLCVVNQENS